jgi:3-oxoacyl-[acyl-carrier-protein] synthase-1
VGCPPLLVAIDEPGRPDYAPDLPERLLEEVGKALGFRFPLPSGVFPGGTTGFFRLLERARQMLAGPTAQGCIVAAVDSLVNSRALHWLEEHGRLKTPFESDGVIPGEAAAAIWVRPAASSGSSLLDIIGLGFGQEPSLKEEDRPNLAVGLAEALRAALSDAHLSLPEIDFRVGGMTGERAGFMEASTGVARIQRVHKENFVLWVPAEKLGDVGAALPACMLVITAVAMAKGYAPGGRALLFISARNPERAACVLEKPQGV